MVVPHGSKEQCKQRATYRFAKGRVALALEWGYNCQRHVLYSLGPKPGGYKGQNDPTMTSACWVSYIQLHLLTATLSGRILKVQYL
jgi:hypothetical protein